MKMKKSIYVIEKSNSFAIASILCMVFCVLIRIFYFLEKRAEFTELLVHLIIPAASAVIFILTVLFLGEKRSDITVLSVALGVLFFVIKSFSFESKTHTVLCIILYIGVMVLYSLTLFGVIPTKKLLYPLFGLPLIYHIFVEDMKLYVFAEPKVPFFEWLPEISVLLIMTGLLFISFAIKRQK